MNLSGKTNFDQLIHSRKINGITRYSLEHVVRPSSVSEHSYWVTILALLIADEVRPYYASQNQTINLSSVVKWGLFHDMGEGVEDDIDFHAKRSIVNKDSSRKLLMENFSQSIYEKYFHYLVDDSEIETSVEYQIMKIADICEHLLYCWEEVNFRGNRALREPITTGLEVLEENDEIMRNSELIYSIYKNLQETLQNKDWAI